MTRFRPTKRTALALLGVMSTGSVLMQEPQAQQSNALPAAWMLFVDDLHLDFRNTGRLRDLLRTIIDTVAEPGDIMAIRTSGPSAVFADFSDAGRLLAEVKRVTGNGLLPRDIIAGAKSGDWEVRYRAHQSLSDAISATAVLGQVGPPARGLIYLSNGYPFDVAARPEYRALAQVAGTIGVRVFTVYGRILGAEAAGQSAVAPASDEHLTAERTSLQLIARDSGGFAVLEAYDLSKVLRRISTAIR
jgi:hypothetical protein